MNNQEKTEFSKKALAELKRRREIRELEFKLYGKKRLQNFLGRQTSLAPVPPRRDSLLACLLGQDCLPIF